MLNDPDVADGGQARYFTRSPIVLVQLVRDAIKALEAARSGHEYHHWIHDRFADEVEDQFRRMAEFQKRTGVSVLVAVVPVFSWGETYPWLDVHLRLKGLAARNALRFVDLRSALGRHRPNEVGLDIWHPNTRGHRIIAEALRDEVLAVSGAGRLGGEVR
jgi:hypothetical protein